MLRFFVTLALALFVASATASVSFAQSQADPNELALAGLAAEAAAVANFLEISPEQLQDELVGHSLAQVAQQHGRTAAEVTTVVVETAHSQIDAAVEQGQLSPEEAAQYKRQVVKYAPLVVNSSDASAFALGAVDSDCVVDC